MRSEKPLAVREYEADRALFEADPEFASEFGVDRPLPPLPPPNIRLVGGAEVEVWAPVMATMKVLGRRW